MSAKPRKNTLTNPPQTRTVAPTQESSVHAVSTQWQGPLPHPDALDKFNQIIPNGAERIMLMCEKEQAARIVSERLVVVGEVGLEIGGRAVGAILLLACIGAAVWSISVDAYWPVTMGFLSVPVMGTLAKLFERRRKS